MAEALPTQRGCRWGYVGAEPPTHAAKRAFDREWDNIDWRSDAQGDWGFLDIDGSKWAVYVTADAYAYFECRKGPPRQAYDVPDRERFVRSETPPPHPMAHLWGTGTNPIKLDYNEIFPMKKPRRPRW